MTDASPKVTSEDPRTPGDATGSGGGAPGSGPVSAGPISPGSGGGSAAEGPADRTREQPGPDGGPGGTAAEAADAEVAPHAARAWSSTVMTGSPAAAPPPPPPMKPQPVSKRPDEPPASDRDPEAGPDREPVAEAEAGPDAEDDGFPFDLDDEEPRRQPAGPATGGLVDESWPPPQMRAGRPRRATAPRPRRPATRIGKAYRHPAAGLSALLLLALLAGFFAWVSADPFWLSVGHSQRGTATVTTCTGKGLGARCTGGFTADRFAREKVTLTGVPQADQHPGAKVAARMVSAKSRVAYVGEPADLYSRWALGIALVLLCGLGIAWATGAGRLAEPNSRLAAYGLSLGAPLLLLIGMLVATY